MISTNLEDCRLPIASCRFADAVTKKAAILLVLIFLVFTQTASAQCNKRVADLPPAPELLGFRLGMTKEEIKARIPQAVFGRVDAFGVSKTTINPHFDPRIDKTKFEGVRSISLDLLDDRLTSLWIGFDETFKVHTVEDFIDLISKSLQIPDNWSSWRSRGQQLRCADFQLIVTTVGGGPSLRLMDLGAEDMIAERRQAKEEQVASAEEADSTDGDESTEIIADKQTKTYYRSGCQPPKEIAELNKVTFKTTAEAEQAGFKPAKNCQ
jgi:hypothetical protein